MRKIIVLTAILVLAAAGVAMAQSMANSKHDLSSASTATIKATDTDQVCIFCHTPHRGDPVSRRPLWNKTLTTQNLTWNPSATTRGTTLPTAIAGTELTGSRACLSCHDGTVALGSVLIYYDQSGTSSGAKAFKVSLYGAAGSDTAKFPTGSPAYLNPANMQYNHPVGVVKPADAEGFTKFKASPSEAVKGVTYDAGGYVQCQSCHNPHLTTIAPFLRISNANSAICKSCHDL